MDVMLQSHEAKRVFPVPEGLRELSSDICREVLRSQPLNIYGFIAGYCEALLATRENAIVAVEMVDQLIEHDVTFNTMLQKRGISTAQAHHASVVIQAAFRGFFTRRSLKENAITGDPMLLKLGVDEELANRATIKIQAAFRGYFTRKTLRSLNLLRSAVVGGETDHGAIIRAVLERTGLSLGGVNEAAIRIQKVFRSYSVRKSLKELGSGEPTEEGHRRYSGSATISDSQFVENVKMVKPSVEPASGTQIGDDVQITSATEVIQELPRDKAESVVIDKDEEIGGTGSVTETTENADESKPATEDEQAQEVVEDEVKEDKEDEINDDEVKEDDVKEDEITEDEVKEDDDVKVDKAEEELPEQKTDEINSGSAILTETNEDNADKVSAVDEQQQLEEEVHTKDRSQSSIKESETQLD